MHLLEMHGTGTPLGDPIELGAAAAVLLGGAGGKGATSRQVPLTLTALKSEMGHAEPAAGVAGLLRLKAQVGAG
jgi:acyl transferase domain-containing protein